MSEILSQDEIDQLLSAIKGGEVAAREVEEGKKSWRSRSFSVTFTIRWYRGEFGVMIQGSTLRMGFGLFVLDVWVG